MSKSDVSTIYLQGSNHNQNKPKFRGHYISPERKGTPLEAINGYEKNESDPKKVVRTNAVYYTSSIYPEALTPEYILGNKYSEKIKRGQIPAKFAKYSPFEAWDSTVNHAFQKRNDFQQVSILGMDWCHNQFYDREPKDDSLTRNTYDDNLFGQVAGAACVGLQLGTAWGFGNSLNLAIGSDIYQNLSMPQNRWMPKSKATIGFRMRIISSCAIQASLFFGGFALADGLASIIRNKDDLWNCIWGGLASGVIYYSWNPVNQAVIMGLMFGTTMGFVRYGWARDGTQKLTFDVNRPYFGVSGGINEWIFGERKNSHYLTLFNKKYSGYDYLD